MGIDRDKFYTATEVKDALKAVGFTVSKCEPGFSNFLVVATNNFGEESSVSCKLKGAKCGGGGLTGDHGLNGLSESKLQKQ